MLESNAKFVQKHFGTGFPVQPPDKSVIHNAQQFEAQCGCPAAVWIEYSQVLLAHYDGVAGFMGETDATIVTMIMIGFAMGWREAKAQK